MKTTLFSLLSLSAFDDDCRIAIEIFPVLPPANAILVESVDRLHETADFNLLGKDIQAIAIKQTFLIVLLRFVNEDTCSSHHADGEE
jgi:hypothetical protein